MGLGQYLLSSLALIPYNPKIVWPLFETAYSAELQIEGIFNIRKKWVKRPVSVYLVHWLYSNTLLITGLYIEKKPKCF